MPRIPHSDDPPPPDEDQPSSAGAQLGIEGSAEVSKRVEKHIRDADYWATDWRLNELKFEKKSRHDEQRIYLAALREVCLDYSNQTLKEFPLGIARWLAQEAENVCGDLPSQILKRPEEGVQTVSFVQENQFELLREEWLKQSRNPAFILQALSLAKEFGTLPPDWVLDLMIEAGAKVYGSDGDLDFGEALGLTPKKIKEARSAQKKVWVADLVAEAVDAGLTPAEAKELAIFEAEHVYGWPQYAPGTVQKYYEQHANERDGFGRSFMYSLGWYGLGSDWVYQSFRLPYWRRKVLKARLAAYREAYEFYPETNDVELDRAKRLPHVVGKTVDALRRNEPPKNMLDLYVESDF
jgi:hypothetical protein